MDWDMLRWWGGEVRPRFVETASWTATNANLLSSPPKNPCSTCRTLTTPRIATVSSSVTPASSESMGNTAVWRHVALKKRVLQRDQMDPNGPFKVLGVIFEMFCMDEWLSTVCIHLYLSDIHISISDTIYCRCLIWVAIIRVITEHSSTSSRRQDTSSKPLDGWFVPRVSFRDVMVSWKGHHISPH